MSTKLLGNRTSHSNSRWVTFDSETGVALGYETQLRLSSTVREHRTAVPYTGQYNDGDELPSDAQRMDLGNGQKYFRSHLAKVNERRLTPKTFSHEITYTSPEDLQRRAYQFIRTGIATAGE